MNKSLRISVLLLCFFYSCSLFKKDNSEQVVKAKVGDKVLYLSDVQQLTTGHLSKDDSLKITKNFVDNWVRQEAVMLKAEANLKGDSVYETIKKQLEDYRNSLVRFAYEKELIRQKLDTVVSSEEIEQYYNNNKSNFGLKDNIIKVIYLKVNRKSPKIAKAKEWYKSDNEKDRKLLEDYCHQFAENYFLDQDTWLLFDDLLKEIPIRTYDKEQFLKNNRFIEIEDSNYLYLVNIKGFRIKDSVSPLVFEKDNIAQIILNKRKLKLIEEMEKSAYDEAQKNGQIEVH